MASPGFQITDSDRQQFISTVRDPSFFKGDDQSQRQKLDSLSLFQRMPEAERSAIVDGLMRHRDALRQRISSLPSANTATDQRSTQGNAPPPEGIGQKIWNFATTPISEQFLGTGKNLTSYAQAANKRTEAEDVAQNRPQFVRTAHRFLDPMAEESAKALDAVQTPLGIVTAGAAPKAIQALEGGGSAAKAFLPYVKGAEKLVRAGFGVDMLGNFAHSAVQFAQDPTPEGFSRMLSQGVLAAGVLKPEIRSRIEKTKSRFGGKDDIPSARDALRAAANEPPSPKVNYEAGAKRFDVSPDTYRGAHEMSLEDLAKATYDARQKANDLDSLRKYNEQAGAAIAGNDRKLNDLRAKRNMMELNLEDTKTIDKQINEMQQRLNAVKAKVAENHSHIEEMKAAEPHNHARMYEDVLMERSAPPTPGTAQHYGAPTPGPGRVQPEHGRNAEGQQVGANYRSQVPPQRPPLRRGNVIGPTVYEPEVIEPQTPAPPAPMREAQVVRTPEQIEATAPAQLPPARAARRATPQESEQAAATGTAAGVPRPVQPIINRTGTPVEGVPQRPQLPPASQIQRPGVVTPPARQLAPPKAPFRLYAEGERPPVQRTEAPPSAPPKVAPKFTKESTGRKAEATAPPEPPKQPATKPPSAPSNRGEKQEVESPKRQEQKAKQEEPKEPASAEIPKQSREEKERLLDEIGLSSEKKEKLRRFLEDDSFSLLYPNEMEADPDRFQFKADAIGKGGTTDELREVKKVDPNSLGTILVWKDPVDGKTYVVNGHHRLELVKRLGYDKPIPVRYIDAADAADARSIGALANLKEGKGSSLDVAKVLREGDIDQQTLDDLGISTKTRLSKEGLALSKLHDIPFQAVATGKIPEGRGVAIGSILKSPADQEAAVKLAEYIEKSGRKVSDAEFAEALKMEVANAPKKEERHEDMFGVNTFIKNLVLEKAEVSEYAKRELSRDKRLFSLVGRRASSDKLSQAGNKLAQESNKQYAQETGQALEVYNKLSKSGGPIADILDKAAHDLAEGMDAGDVKRKAYAAIRKELEKFLSTINAGTKSKDSG